MWMVRLFFVLCCGILCAKNVYSSRPDQRENSSVQHELLARTKDQALSPHSVSLHGLLPVPVRRSEGAGPASVRGIITLDGMLESLGKYGMEPNAPKSR